MTVFDTQDIIKRLRIWQPVTPESVLVECALPLLYLGGGQFRNTFQIVGTDLALKMPLKDRTYAKNIRHARCEYAALLAVNHSTRKYLAVKKYMPVIHHFSSVTGVTLVQKYNLADYGEHKAEIDQIGSHLVKVTGHKSHDLNNGTNVGIDDKGGLRLIDLGYLLRYS